MKNEIRQRIEKKERLANLQLKEHLHLMKFKKSILITLTTA